MDDDVTVERIAQVCISFVSRIRRLFACGCMTLLPPPKLQVIARRVFVTGDYVVWVVSHELACVICVYDILTALEAWLVCNLVWIAFRFGVWQPALCDIGVMLGMFASFWHCWSFQRCVSSDSWHRMLRAIYIQCGVPIILGGVKLFGDSSEMELCFYDIIRGMDWLLRHRVVLDCMRARVQIPGTEHILLHVCYILRSYWTYEQRDFWRPFQ